MFDRIVWWSVWRRRIRRWFERCHEVCSHTNIWCFLWMYRNVQFKHCIGSFVFALFSFLMLNREYNLLKSQFNANWHGCKFYSCKRPSLPPNNITMIDFFLHRSKRGVEKKANYPNIRDKRSPFSMLEKRLPHRGFKPEDKKQLNWVHIYWKLHLASSDWLCFVNQVDVVYGGS